MFGVNEYNPVLNAEADARGVKRYHQTVLVSVDGEKKEATFRKIGGEDDGTEMTMPFAMLHVTPPMSVPEVLKSSSLLNESVSAFAGGGEGSGKAEFLCFVC